MSWLVLLALLCVSSCARLLSLRRKKLFFLPMLLPRTTPFTQHVPHPLIRKNQPSHGEKRESEKVLLGA